MLQFTARRLAYIFPIAIGVTLICFILTYLAPGDPISTIIPDNTPPEIAAQIRAAYGFDKPLPMQYLIWLGRVLTGDLGMSLTTRRTVLSEIIPACINTFKLAGGAILLSCVIGVLLGTLAAYRQGKLSDRAISSVGIALMSVPQYWLGTSFVIIFAVQLGMLPATGMGNPSADNFAKEMSYMILPMITLAVTHIGVISRSVRSTVGEILQQDFVEALYAKGLTPFRVFLHVAKNAAPPILAIIGLQVANLLGGSILVETVFAWPGTGSLLNSAIFMRDLPLLQGTILVLAMFFVFTNLTVDVLQMALDPRMKSARSTGGHR